MEEISDVPKTEVMKSEDKNDKSDSIKPSSEQKEKKKKLTNEEKIALKIEKMKKKKEKALEDRKQALRDHLSRELNYTEITYKRAFTEWEEMCMKIKVTELKEELMYLWQELNSILDRKNYQITLLQEELVIAEEQYQRNFSKHIEIMDFLIKFLKYSLNAMKVAYDNESYKLIKQFLIETNALNKVQDKRKTFYENVLHSTNFSIQQKLKEMKSKFEEQKTDIIDSNIVQRYVYKDTTITKMAQLYNQLLTIVQSLQQDALDPKRNTRYSQYVRKQQAASAEFEKMKEAASKGQEIIYALHRKLNRYETIANSKIMDLKNERTYYVEHYWDLKENYKKEVEFAEDQLSILANESYKALTKLKDEQKVGELLIGLAQCCRKLQTESEKVLPWPSDDAVNEIMKQFDDSDKKMEHVGQMQLFSYRTCRAQTHVLCLKEEKRKLEKENASYCEKLRSCFEVETYDKIIKSLSIDPQPLSIINSSCPVCGGKQDE